MWSLPLPVNSILKKMIFGYFFRLSNCTYFSKPVTCLITIFPTNNNQSIKTKEYSKQLEIRWKIIIIIIIPWSWGMVWESQKRPIAASELAIDLRDLSRFRRPLSLRNEKSAEESRRPDRRASVTSRYSLRRSREAIRSPTTDSSAGDSLRGPSLAGEGATGPVVARSLLGCIWGGVVRFRRRFGVIVFSSLWIRFVISHDQLGEIGVGLLRPTKMFVVWAFNGLCYMGFWVRSNMVFYFLEIPHIPSFFCHFWENYLNAASQKPYFLHP